MADDLQALKDRLVKLSDEELIDIVLAPAGEYRQEALDIANAELKWRRVEIPKPDEESESEPEAVSHDPLRVSSNREAASTGGCPFCNGPLRPGTLVGEKEITVVFSDNHEERFVKVNVCTQCGQLSMVADLET